MSVHEQLRSVCSDLYVTTGIKAVVYDADMRVLLAHPGAMGQFCSTVRKYGCLSKECLRCDHSGLARCRESGQFHIYRCHMGLTEAATPIIDGGMVIGYLLFGQLLSEGDRDAVLERIEILPDEGDRTILRAAVSAMESVSREKLAAAARLMTMCACYIRLNNILAAQQGALSVRIGKYIDQRLPDPALSIDQLTREFSISRSTLYTLSKQAFGMGITDYIRKMRLLRAETLLKTTDMPVFEIAAAVGLSDPDYLSRLLHRTTGKTPRQIRKSAGTQTI